MPLGKIISNNKSTVLQKKSWRKHRIRKAERVRRQGGHTPGDIADPELITVHMLKKRRTSPRANITLSGKKKRKLIKRLKHSQPKAVSRDVEMESAPSKKRRGKKVKVKDVEMEEEEEDKSDNAQEDEEETMD